MTIPQLKMLRLFLDATFDQTHALKLDQRTFGGLCYHGWVDYSAGARNFYITSDGLRAYELASRTHNFRKHNNGRFSVRVPKVRRAQVIKISNRRSAA